MTASRVAILPPGRHVDPGQTGLYLLVRPRTNAPPSRTWVHRVKWRGKDTYLLVGHFPQTGLEQARNDVRDAREDMAKGIDPARAKARRKVPTVARTLSSGAADQYVVESVVREFMERAIGPNRKRPEYVQAILDRDVLPEWGARDVRKIVRRDVVALLDRIVDRGSPVAANRTAATLSQLFEFALDRDLIESNPVRRGYRPGGTEKERQRALSDAELAAYLADPTGATRYRRLAHVITLLLLTGQRRGELALARWRDIDFEARTWQIPASNSKNGRAQLVPLSEWAVAEFKQLKKAAGRSAFVLPGTDPAEPVDAKLLTRGVAKCAKRFAKLGIEEFTLHDLRRTVRTGLGRLKVEPHIAERILGHSLGKVERTYDVHGYLEEKRDALCKWARHLSGLARA